MKILMQKLLELQTLEFDETASPQSAAAIAELRDTIPPQILGHYDRLRVRGKKGLVAVKHQVCAGCHMQVPLGAILTLKHGDDMQLCENCGRYLYLPP
jgi:predicted  nucleic acid-binding Zn-ribbon protein